MQTRSCPQHLHIASRIRYFAGSRISMLSSNACRHRCAMDGHPSRRDMGAAAAVDLDRSGHHSPWCADAAHAVLCIMRAVSLHSVLAVEQVLQTTFVPVGYSERYVLHCRGAYATELRRGSQSGQDGARLPACAVLVQVTCQ